ncbi:GTP-binding protein EngB required for normal cell division [Kibdelosporangium banguiense]|uniref:GTP-binding protein EngB required for normal cell division n=1 Tax=Kibdelosporangium banguiense TaxID=1365924 RepID=A0ABS4U120_9PSEU|nr:dynamin family protein [Kibdelosporangium banguiense]MBP2329900.1 GTP-binding protein EngB required for normal cell division [Kibdelosporangium banguiense]
MTVSLAQRVRALLSEATAAYQGRQGGRVLNDVARHLDGPLRVAIAGRVKAGKSTLLNALVGTRIAATDAGECTRIVTWYARGPEPRATAFPHGTRPIGLSIENDGNRYTLDLGRLDADSVDRVEVSLPSDWLNQMTLVDTPGMGSLTESAGRRTQDFLGETGSVDAVLYLMRHLHSTDIDFLDAFHDGDAAETTPVNAVGVLSRADEVGGGEEDAIAHAGKVAAGYRADSRIRSLVHTVMPVAGLLAETAATLGDAEFADLASIAKASEGATMPLMLSAARFVSPSRTVSVSPDARRRLLGMLGMYGVRLSLETLRAGEADRIALCNVLRERSGLAELRRLLLTQFAQRRDVLKADGALRAIETVTRNDPIPAAPRLRQAVERLRAGAHELTELRLLTELRTGSVQAPAEQLAVMERLLGGQGASVADRLNLRPDAPFETVQAAITGMHGHWRRVAGNALIDPSFTRAAQVLQRTCEGLAAAIRTAPQPNQSPGQRSGPRLQGQPGSPQRQPARQNQPGPGQRPAAPPPGTPPGGFPRQPQPAQHQPVQPPPGKPQPAQPQPVAPTENFRPGTGPEEETTAFQRPKPVPGNIHTPRNNNT